MGEHTHFSHQFVSDNPGSISDFYDVDREKLGQGSCGSVSKCIRKDTKAIRAVKTINLANLKDKAKFEAEIGIMKLIDHPNIIKLHETFQDAKMVYLIMELCTGGELFDWILEKGENGFGERQASSYMRQILAAIFYLHRHSIAHRDIKPENFLLQHKGSDAPIKVIDFGLASKFEKNKVMKTKTGTPCYVAPEVFGDNGYDEKADVWSCGVVCYVLLCGYPPFYGETTDEMIQCVKKGEFDFPEEEWDEVSTEAKNLIQKMLSFNSETRPDAETLLCDPWVQQKAAEQKLSAQSGSKVLGQLKKFQQFSRMKKVALTAIAKQLSDSDIEELKDVFIALDKNGDGTLTPLEIKEGIEKADVKVPDGLAAILLEVDSDGSGSIDYTEFLAATIDKRLYIKEDVLWSAFKTFDVDGNGTIDKTELRKVLADDSVQDVMGMKDIELMIKDVDNNGDGAIDFDEFCAMMKGA